MKELSGKRIVLGVTGGIAAYKSAELVRLLGKAGADVHVVLTEGGARFVTAVTFQALSGNPVWTDLWDARMPDNMAHIDLSGTPTPFSSRPPVPISWRNWPRAGPMICSPPCAWPVPPSAPCWWRRP